MACLNVCVLSYVPDPSSQNTSSPRTFFSQHENTSTIGAAENTYDIFFMQYKKNIVYVQIGKESLLLFFSGYCFAVDTRAFVLVEMNDPRLPLSVKRIWERWKDRRWRWKKMASRGGRVVKMVVHSVVFRVVFFFQALHSLKQCYLPPLVAYRTIQIS